MPHFKNLSSEIKTSLKSIKNLKAGDIEKILSLIDRKIMRRKCDFDIEIVMDVYKHLEKIKTFIFFSGDGDFAPLLEFLLDNRKQAIVVFAEGHLGKEIVKLKHRAFLCNVKNIPPISRGA